MYGKIEIEYYQVTPIGLARIQSGQLGALDLGDRDILKGLLTLGGTAEIDELKTSGLADSPMSLRVSLSRLVDLGYVVPVQAGVPEQEIPV